MHEWAQTFVNPKTGATKTPYEVKKEADAELEADLQETWDKTKAFQVTDKMIDDWTGHKYITSHRCFGSPCPKDLVQMRNEDEDSSDDDEDDEQQVFLNKFNLHPTHLAQN